MSQYGAGKCVLCGAVDDYCQIGAYFDIDCRDLADTFKVAVALADNLRGDDLTLLHDGRVLIASVDEYKQVVRDREDLRNQFSDFTKDENSG